MFYYKMRYFTTECGNSIGYTITNSSISLQSTSQKFNLRFSNSCVTEISICYINIKCTMDLFYVCTNYYFTNDTL